jgi:hypothetical protein
VRLVGVALSRLQLEEGLQIVFPFDHGADRARAVDAVREKFGYDSVHLATTLQRGSRGARAARR